LEKNLRAEKLPATQQATAAARFTRMKERSRLLAEKTGLSDYEQTSSVQMEQSLLPRQTVQQHHQEFTTSPEIPSICCGAPSAFRTNFLTASSAILNAADRNTTS